MSDPTIQIRSLSELHLDDIVRIVEKTRHSYQPDLWEDRVTYYLRRDPESSVVAEVDGRVVGFMLGDVRAGEFGIEEPSGWIEVIGVDPEFAGRGVGRALADAMLWRYRERGVGQVRKIDPVVVHVDVGGCGKNGGRDARTAKVFGDSPEREKMCANDRVGL